MATETSLLSDLAIVMGAAALSALLFRRFRLPLLFGFLAAGFLIGPHSRPFVLVEDEERLKTLAELGVVLLLFGLGLDFNFRKLTRVGPVALIVMMTQSLLVLWLGFELGQYFGWDQYDSIFLGATLSISSTVITVKVLRDLGRLESEGSRTVLGVLVLQDLLAILILVVLGGYAQGRPRLGELGDALGGMALFLAATVFLGLLLVPRIVDWIARHHPPELLLLSILGIAFGYALLSLKVGFHAGLGAFLMGALVSEAKEHKLVEQQVRPVHDVFGAIFFVSLGTLVDPAIIVAYWKPVVAIFALVVVGKVASGAMTSFLMGFVPRAAFVVGAGLSNIGEFSFIILQLGSDLRVTSDFLLPIIVGVSALTSFTTPLLLHYSEGITRGVGRVIPAPLHTFVRIYSAWSNSIRSRSAPAQAARRIRERRAFILAGFLLLTVFGAAWVIQGPGKRFLIQQGVDESGSVLTYWAVVLALLLPLLFRFYYTMHKWLGTYQQFSSGSGRPVPGVRRTIKYSFYLLSVIFLGLPIVAATRPFLDTPVVAGVWIGVVTLSAVILWTSVTRLHSHIESNIHSLLDYENVPIPSPQIVRDLMTSELPWELRVESFDLGAHSWAAGKPVSDTQLRSSTGASLILIERGDHRQQTPDPSTILFPGDRLTVIGSQEQLDGARALLTRPVPTGPLSSQLRLGRLYVSEGSHLDGVQIAQAGLPSLYGLQVVGIAREERVIPNPPASETFQPGDIVIVLGSQDKIAAATGLGGAKRPSPAPAPPA